MSDDDSTERSKDKNQVWEALAKDLPVPALYELVNRPMTPTDLDYLRELFAAFLIWDVYNLDAPSAKTPLKLEGASDEYDIYDRGSCLVGSPKQLFSHRRTREDADETVRAMIREVYRRGWMALEFSDTKRNKMLQRMMRVAWVEAQIQSDLHEGRQITILHYVPDDRALKLYAARSSALTLKT